MKEVKYVTKEDKNFWYSLGFTVDIPGFEQPMEMFMSKKL